MRLRKMLMLALVLVLVTGCSEFVIICSLNPFYKNENVVIDPKVEGDWLAKAMQCESDAKANNSVHWYKADTALVWRIKQIVSVETVKNQQGKDSTVYKPQNSYVVKLCEHNSDSVQYQFMMVLFKVRGNLYADFSPHDTPSFKNSLLLNASYFSVHTLASVSFQGQKMKVSWLDHENMKSMIEEKRVRIKYKYVRSVNRLLLTATTNDLTEMIERYAHQKRFIDWDNQRTMLEFTNENK